MAKLRNKLASLLAQLPPDIQERFPVSEVLDGYSSFMAVFRKLENDFLVHEIYIQWYRENLEQGESESCKTFAGLFECVQVGTINTVF